MSESPYEMISRLLWEMRKEVAGKTPEELLTNWMNDRQNKSHTTYTCPVTNNSNITLGGTKGVANDRRDVMHAYCVGFDDAAYHIASPDPLNGTVAKRLPIDLTDKGSYSDRIAKLKTKTCGCGRKLRGKEALCRECR